MKMRAILAVALAAGMISLLSSEAQAKRFGRGASCGCDVTPSCGCDMGCSTCVAAPSCGCDMGCAPVCDPCCKPKRGGFLKKLFSRKNKCCAPTCCDVAPSCGCDMGCGGCNVAPSCGCDMGCGGCNAAPSCGCDVAPTCGCEPVCCDPCCKPKRGGFLKKLFSRKNKCCAPSCCDVAPTCGCDMGCSMAPSCGCDAAPSCGCGCN